MGVLANVAAPPLQRQVVAIGRGCKPVAWPYFELGIADCLDAVAR